MSVMPTSTRPQVQIEFQPTSETQQGQERQFSLNVTKIMELNSVGESVREVSTLDLNFTMINSTSGINNIYNYSSYLENGAYFSLIVSLYFIIIYLVFLSIFWVLKVYEFLEDTDFNFAGTLNSFSKNTLKFGVTVYNWPFLSLSHSLGIIFDSPQPDQEVTCTQNNKDLGGSLQWFLVVVDGISLYPFTLWILEKIEN